MFFLQELGYALRQLRKAPLFTLLAALTLALGIGASTAIFTLVDSVILKPLSYRDSGKLVVAWERVKFLGPSTPYVGPNPRHVDLWRQRTTAFSGLSLLQERARGVALGASEHPQLTGTITATSNLLEVLQVTPMLGRKFRPDDSIEGRDNVAILTYSLWQRLFQGDPKVIGRTLRIGDVPHEVVGVLPESFRFPNGNALSPMYSKQASAGVAEPAVLLPAVIDLSKFDWNGEYGNWVALARLKPGVSVARAEAQLNTVQSQIVQQIPADQMDKEPNALLARVEPMQEVVAGRSGRELWLLMAAVIGLMLIACVNLANAQLGRGLAREREAAIRSALGASAWQLLWSSLAESLLLAGIGGVAGILIAYEGLALFTRYTPIDLPRLAEVHLNVSVLLFATVLIMGSAVLFGILPALNFMRTDPQRALQQNSGRTAGSRQSRRLRKWLIAVQVCGCTALLLVAGLFAKSLLHLIESDKGFETGQVAVAEVDLSHGFEADEKRTEFDDAVLSKLRVIPGVRSAALVSAMPLEGETWIDGINRADRPTHTPPLANFRWVSPGYFETIRERLIAGRFFEERDRNQNTIVISEAAARAAWPGENPVGMQMKHGGSGKKYTVIGMVANARNNSLKLAPANMVYFHFKDNPPSATYFLVRSTQPVDQLGSRIRQAIWSQAPAITIARIKTLDSQLSDSLAPERFQTDVLAAFGAAALVLAMLGIYAVLSYTVAARTQEIGVRMALGATRESIYGLTIKEAMLPVLAGFAGGWAASIGIGRVVETMLYGVGSVDLNVSLAVGVVFPIAATVAASIPAMRAASVDPMASLRAD